ncbi:AbiJ-NTD4 domain-containing protein [uncultured Porphyromonas sp.]|uniref:AbiJ-NTD4 domain-containing protein n=1 Tax=uncultured Porphyromonas sp. TaxID=159274 RepID=UPI002633AAE0|nr:hypothetical protein [uncultured Porphyromonas sp.]
MPHFSERNGYVSPSKVLIRETITTEIENCICNCYSALEEDMEEYHYSYEELVMHLWTKFMNQRASEFQPFWILHGSVISPYLLSQAVKWYKKLDLIEETIEFLRSDYCYPQPLENFVKGLNSEFERLTYGYRIVNNQVTPITDEVQISAIQKPLESPTVHENIRRHLNNALRLYSQQPQADYQNSIKESISAVECLCRSITEENTLGKALYKLEKSGAIIHPQLEEAFKKLYSYANQGDTGIRHALMSPEDNYVPQSEEALYMLVSCCSFVTYICEKQSRIQ